MDIVIEKEKEDRIIDGINCILQMDENMFNKVIELLSSGKESRINFWYASDKCEYPKNKLQIGLSCNFDNDNHYIGRSYFGVKPLSLHYIFNIIKSKFSSFSPDSKEYQRINALLNSRNLNHFKINFAKKAQLNSEFIDVIFNILEDDSMFEKFLSYEKNEKLFEMPNLSVNKSRYLRILARIFGKTNSDGTIQKNLQINSDYYVENLQKYYEKYLKICNTFNMERYTNPAYEFKGIFIANGLGDTIIRRNDEPSWNINPALYSSIYEQMPKDLSLEEKAIYIYTKLCKEFIYDQGYFYRERTPSTEYEYNFSKDRLEKITVGSKITCFDFSRIFSQFINELDGDINAVIISKGINNGHFSTGFYTDKVSVVLEAINAKTSGTNDLMKAKNGIKFEGISIISDKYSVIPPAIEKVYSLIFSESQKRIDEYIGEVKKLPDEQHSHELIKKLEAALQIIKDRNLIGNEAVQTLDVFSNFGFFGDDVKKVFIGKLEIEGKKKRYKRIILFQQSHKEEKSTRKTYYLLDTEKLSVSLANKDDIIEKLGSGEYVYESKKHKIEGLGEKE